MPMLTSPEIAVKFKEKWLSTHPNDRDSVSGLGTLDDSLTNLQWLQDFSILTANLERHSTSGGHPQRFSFDTHPPGTESPSSPPAGDTAASGVPQSLSNPITSSATTDTSGGDYLNHQATKHVYHHRHHTLKPPEEVDYKTNHRVKPPHSYATLICMAMQASKKTKITLSAIYNWITENFCYYRHAEPSWQNSIRHNLSLNKCFLKVPRTQEEPGKGGFWQIDPQHVDMFVDGVFKRRRTLAAPQRQQGEATSQHAHKRRKHPLEHGAWGSPLLALRPEVGGASADVLDWASWFEDGGGGNGGGTFEDLDINAALSSLGCEPDASLQGSPLVAGGGWYGGSGGTELACVFAEAGESTGGHPLHRQQGAARPRPPSRPPQYEEPAPFFQQPLPWAELKEEFQPAPFAMDHVFACYGGFFHEPLPWEGVESYL